MNKGLKALLILVVVVCFVVAISYPIRYHLEEKGTESTMEHLQALKDSGSEERGASEERERRKERSEGEEGAEESVEPAGSELPEGTAPSESVSGGEEAQPLAGEGAGTERETERQAGEGAEPRNETEPQVSEAAEPKGETESQVSEGAEPRGETEPQAGEAAEPKGETEPRAAGQSAEPDELLPPEETAEPVPTLKPGETLAPGSSPTPTPSPTPIPTPTVNRFERDGAIPYDQKEKRTLDVEKILPQFKEIYEENHDFVGWIAIPGTVIDYPVVQTEDSEFYLKHDFYGKKNANGQIILDTKCDPYTPSYNLVVSGHSMKSGKMFGRLVNYMYKSYWEDHKLVYFDTLMDERTYVAFAAFFSADYDVDEAGFRYNADIRYSLDARQWLREVKENELYDTGIDAEFGDEFLTLTTCNKAHRSDGRFVVVCRRLREGEEIE